MFISEEYQNKLNTFIKFILKYNYNKFVIKNDLSINSKEIYNVFVNIVIRCKIITIKLEKIFHHAKLTKSDDVFQTLSITNLFKLPGNFIEKEYQLITYKQFIHICDEYKINVSEETKIEKWIYYYFLHENKFYAQKNKFLKDVEKEFKISVSKIMDNLCQKNKFMYVDIDKKKYATTDYLYNLEKSMGDLFLDLFFDKKYYANVDKQYIKGLISDFCDEKQMKQFVGEQITAIMNSIQNKFSIIVGPPGTGKTSVVTCILYLLNVLYDVKYDNISILAPTGKAFMNLKNNILEKGIFFNEKKSGTLHKILYGNNNEYTNNEYTNNEYTNNEYTNNVYTYNEYTYNEYTNNEYTNNVYTYNVYNNNNNNKIDVIVVDEVSMIDNFLFNDLLKKCQEEQCRLIFLGDHKQLPSIKAGIILEKLINCNDFDNWCVVNRLDKIHRQSGGLLLDSIYKMTRNEIIKPNNVIDNVIDNTLVLKSINEINEDNIYDHFKNLVVEEKLEKNNCKFICPFKTYNKFINTVRINMILQNIFNPISVTNYEINNKHNKTLFRINDKIIRTENSYDDDTMRANGQEAIITNYDGNNIYILYEGDENEIKIDLDELNNEFDLNYCITTHKSQGSQYENVVYLIDNNATDFFVDHTNIYTAISRAKSRCIIYTNLNKFENFQKKCSDRVSIFMDEFENYCTTEV